MSETAESKRPEKVRDLSKLPTDLDYLIGKAEVSSLIGISGRTLQSMMSSGEFPAPDTRIGTMPRWRISTYKSWLKRRCERNIK
jgi:predicted DNA-binding transcriptional regulator AlpA